MKYLEQRVEELELEVKLLKAKNKLNDTSSYLNNYPPYNSYTGHYWDSSELQKNPLDTITVNLSSITDDSIQNLNYVESSDLPEYYPPYPDIIGSFDDTIYSNPVEQKIEKDFGKIIYKFKILSHEWEMDGYGYIVRDIEYNKNIIVTNHGKPIVVNKDYLNDVISTYKETIQETERALFLIK
jgi:hypothetical protein